MRPRELVEAGLVIHVAICEEGWDDCREDHGRCMRAATKLYHEGKLKEAAV